MTHGPIFIVGYMHSGTSMLQHALGSHGQLFSTRGETKYFCSEKCRAEFGRRA